MENMTLIELLNYKKQMLEDLDALQNRLAECESRIETMYSEIRAFK